MNLLSLDDWSAGRIDALLRLAGELKAAPARRSAALRGRTLLMMFQKPSLRTRVSFEAAMLQLGGHAIAYDLSASPWGHGKETPADTARTLSRYVDVLMARLYRHEDLEALAAAASIPVINGLTDLEHPCQALGDLLTLREKKGRLSGLRLAYVGDGDNNVTHSLMDACARTGIAMAVACPDGYEPRPRIVERARRAGLRLEIGRDPRAAVAGADAVYTDTWMSYHIPPERKAERVRALEPYRVTRRLLAAAPPEAVVMHCLPAERGAELEAEVLDGPQSIVFDQAENRLHTEKALLLTLLEPREAA